MDTTHYNIVFYGELCPGHAREDVKNNLAAIFKLDANQLEPIFTQTPYLVKSNVEHQTALQYQAAFERAGALCRIEVVTQDVPPSNEPLQSDVAEPHEQHTMVCPKCGYEQEEALRCSQCGIFIKTYLKKQEQKAQQRDHHYKQPHTSERFMEPSPVGQFFSRIADRIVGGLVVAAIALGIAYCSAREQVIKSDNGAIRLTKPRGWRVDNDLNEDADIQISHEAKEGYLIVISERKTDFERYMTYEGHSALTREFVQEALFNYQEISGPTAVEINHMKGVQYEITGSVDGLKIIYLHTTLEGTRYFHQLIAWSLPSKYAENKPVFDRIIQSFHEL